MNEYGVYEITVTDVRLSELIDAVHEVATSPGTGSEHGRQTKNISLTDLEVERGQQDRTTRRNVAGIALRTGADVRLDVMFGLDGSTATARFNTVHTGSDTLAARRSVSFARYLTVATMAALSARGVAAELIQLAVA